MKTRRLASVGYRLFSLVTVVLCCCSPVRPNVLLRPAPTPEPTVNPGDQIRLTVWRNEEYTGEFKVGRDSTLQHPLLQEVPVVGVSMDVVKARLSHFLATYVQNPQIVVEPLYPVSVMGGVRQPNLYTLPGGTTLGQAIATAGGPTERGKMDKVHVFRGNTQVVLNLRDDYVRNGTIPIVSGDQIFLESRPERSFIQTALPLLVSLASLGASIALIINRWNR